MRDNANAVDAEKRATAIVFVICFILDGVKCTAREKGAGLAPFTAHQFGLEPLENCDCDRFGCFQNHVADESVANHDFNRVFEEMATFNVAAKVE